MKRINFVLGVLFAWLFLASATTEARADGFTQTFDFTATERIPTGLIKLGQTDGTVASGQISWGDGTSNGTSDKTSDSFVIEAPCVTCNFWGQHTYSEARNYTVTLSYKDLLGNSHSQTLTATVKPIAGSFIIVSVGDSVASGEGNPVIPVHTPFPAHWDHEGCHLSSLAGPSQAAAIIQKQKENLDKHVTFLHLACSGRGTSAIAGQIATAKKMLDPQPIDALLISAGANDIAGGFGSIVTQCALTDPKFDCNTDPVLVANIVVGTVTMFNGLNSDIRDEINSGSPVDDVYITEYYDPTRNNKGNFPSGEEAAACDVELITHDEWAFLYEQLLVPMNDIIWNSAVANGWHYVGGIASSFADHGYCSLLPRQNNGDPWVRQIQESLLVQGNLSGTAHPNFEGQSVYATSIVEAIHINTTPVTTVSGTGNAGAWSNQSATLEFTATNKLPSAGVQLTYVGVDNPNCDPANIDACDTQKPPFSITISSEGVHTVRYFSQNLHGGFEKVRTTPAIQIDTTPPVVTVTASPAVVEATSKAGAAVTFTATANDNMIGTLSPDCVLDEGSSVQSGATLALGFHKITCGATDAAGNTGLASAEVEVGDTTAPSLTVPSPIVVEAASDAGAHVGFSASATDIVDGTDPVSCAPVSGSLFPLGKTVVSCSTSDRHANAATKTFTVTVRDTTAPAIASVTPSQSVLWPADKSMVPVTVAVAATDAVTAAPSCSIVSVSSNEPGSGQWQVTGPRTLTLRSDRLGTGDGRIYTIAVTCSDKAGNVSKPATTTVTVPHHQDR